MRKGRFSATAVAYRTDAVARERARAAQFAHPDTPCVYDAFLHLLSVGAKPTEAKFLGEARRMAAQAEAELKELP